ncbi:NAD(P)-dependent oxidoreductase [Desulfospira joergensenii]|uniref:NAD(P)-dependent oxidoreductase n=1 Tax=Desulfospira joergensenii TaxID=53329 RepID=UPI0003B7484A|nr:NAD(P)H-binding protein [Desulfospira joergensenii]
MKTTIFGATGNVGSRIVKEALMRGHKVTAVARDEKKFSTLPQGAVGRTGDVSNPEDIVLLSKGQDVVISAIRPRPGNENQLVETTRSILAGLANTNVRLIISGGAGSLIVPGTENRLVVNDPEFVYPSFRDIALACVEQYQLCEAKENVDWVYLCPPAVLKPGKRTGTYRTGKDHLLLNTDGKSVISMEDLAVALMDEVEQPTHNRERFTVAY